MKKNNDLQPAGTERKKIEIPAKLPDILLSWYDENARILPWRQDCDPYHVWLSEIMLQQTRVEAVKAYYIRFLDAVPTIEALAQIEEEKLLKLWEGLGYYSRARNLKKAAEIIVEQHDGRFPRDHAQILKLPGIGAYTAGAIASIAFGQPTPAVDGNVLRVIARICEIHEIVDTPSVKKRITQALEERFPGRRNGDFTQSLMELGATICLPNGSPKCEICPAWQLCEAFRKNIVLEIPQKQERKAKRIQDISVFLFFCNGKIAIRRRENEGLLAGLWEFPNIEQALQPEQVMELAEEWGTGPRAILKTVRRVHVFTHVKWQITCYSMDCTAQPEAFTWETLSRIADAYALPTAFKMFLD